jgi:predicted esterase YcpF (UPF0227 family)
MTIFIHGFGSSGLGSKALIFRKHFKNIDKKIIAPSLSYIPKLAIDTLEQLIQSSCEEVNLIGSSLGGYYSIYLANKYNLKAVLINPAIDSATTLKRILNMGDRATNFYDDSEFDWKVEYLDMLRDIRVDKIDNGKYLLLLQKGDEILDYKEALEKIPNAIKIVEDGGTHQFDKIERYFNDIEGFLFENQN